MHTTSQEYKIKFLTGHGDFSFVIETIVFRLNLSWNILLLYFNFSVTMCNPQRSIKGLFNVAKIAGKYH